MNSALSIGTSFRALLLGAMVLLFAAGCSKNADDCPAPESNDDQVTTRAGGAEQGGANKDELPAGNAYRGVAAGDLDLDGDGINDDGDDEADGEGNKKGRVQH